jgi:hypothetical protein
MGHPRDGARVVGVCFIVSGPSGGHYFNVGEKTREPRTKKKDTPKKIKITQTKQKDELALQRTMENAHSPKEDF